MTDHLSVSECEDAERTIARLRAELDEARRRAGFWESFARGMVDAAAIQEALDAVFGKEGSRC